MERQTWCGQVCAHIRFKPDRETIRRELLGHMEDEYEVLRASGLCEHEAERRMLERMGDPVEVGRLLDQVHSPLLGWLWLVSKALIILAIAATVYCAAVSDWEIYDSWNEHGVEYLDPGMTEMDMGEGMAADRQRYIEPETCQDETDGHVFRVERAAIWEYPSGAGVKYDFFVWLTVSGIWPWEDAVMLNEMYAVDSMGNYYENAESRGHNESASACMLVELAGKSLTTGSYAVQLSDLDPEAQWIELRYDQAGRDIRLRIDLTGGKSV